MNLSNLMMASEPTLPGMSAPVLERGISGGAARSGLDPAQRDFAGLLGIAERRAGTVPESEQDPEKLARDTAERFVSVALVQPILDMARENNNAAPPFQPSRGEKQFRGLIDASTSMEVVRSANFPLVDRLARQLLRQGGHETPQESPGTPRDREVATKGDAA
ncbi:MAG: hypothetical protein AAF235_10695 [Planctomycetota bacterium]